MHACLFHSCLSQSGLVPPSQFADSPCACFIPRAMCAAAGTAATAGVVAAAGAVVTGPMVGAAASVGAMGRGLAALKGEGRVTLCRTGTKYHLLLWLHTRAFPCCAWVGFAAA